MQKSDFMGKIRMGWTSIELPGYRNLQNSSTYGTFDLQKLPPIREALNGSFEWLKRGSPKYLHSIGRFLVAENFSTVDGTLVPEEKNQEAIIEGVDYIENDAVELLQTLDSIGQTLPSPFQEFIFNHELYNRVRSCTHCHLELAIVPAKTIEPFPGYLIRFLVDSQASPSWYLYVNAKGEEAVLLSTYAYGYDSYIISNGLQEQEMETVDLLADDFQICAPSFEEFIYRFWIENEIWFALAFEQEIHNREMLDYLAYYNPEVSM